MKLILYPLYITLFCVTMISCSKDDDQEDIDRRLIQAYIADNDLDADSTASGLYYVIEEPGTGGHPKITDQVQIGYKGTLLNGFVFDENADIDLYLNQVIAGWQEGIPLFGRGGKGTLLIPSHLGYGAQAYATIPAHSVLIFEIHLIDF